MARRKVFGTAYTEDTDGETMITVEGADVMCYEAGTTTEIPMYSDQIGGSALNPSLGGAGLSTSSNGFFEFWIDYTDLIKVEITKVGVSTISRDYIVAPTSDGNLDLDGGTF